MIVDANLLIHAIDPSSTAHRAASAWWSSALVGNERVALPMQTLTAFVRLTTHPRITAEPLSAPEATAHVRYWLSHGTTWVPPTSDATAAILVDLIERYELTANLIPDAGLAALAIEHGVRVASADTDFARFGDVWLNPLAAR